MSVVQKVDYRRRFLLKNGLSMVTMFLFPSLAGSVVAFQLLPSWTLSLVVGVVVFIVGIVATVWLLFSAQKDARASSD